MGVKGKFTLSTYVLYVRTVLKKKKYSKKSVNEKFNYSTYLVTELKYMDTN